jgi:hypothetical protein
VGGTVRSDASSACGRGPLDHHLLMLCPRRFTVPPPLAFECLTIQKKIKRWRYLPPFLTWSAYELSVGVGYYSHGSGAFMAGPAGPRPWNMSCTGERTGKGMVDVKDETMLHFVPPSPSLVEFITCSATVPATFQFTSTRTTLKLPLFLVAFLVATFLHTSTQSPLFSLMLF